MSCARLHKDKDVVKVLREAERQGFDVERTRNGHVQVRRAGRLVWTLPGTASCSRALNNGLADLRRGGFVWPPPPKRG